MKKHILAILIVLLTTLSVGAVRPDYSKIAAHPRLLLASGAEKQIAEAMRREPGLVKVHHRIMRTADASLTKPDLKRIKTGKRLLDVSRDALQRIFYLSYAYRMTGDMKYARRAEKDMLDVSAFTDWNPSHFLDVGEMTMAMAIGYDWLHDVLSDSTRATLRRAIVEKGFKAADNPKHAWFYNSNANWNSVCNGGLTYGALAIHEDEPEISEAIIDKCLDTNPKVMDCYGPDGGYPEGFMYWGYGTGFQVMLIAALESALGTDFGLCQAPGFLNTARFMQYMTAPSGECFNFYDSHARPEANMMLFWFAGKLNDPSVVCLERRYLEDESTYFAEPRLLPSLMVFASKLDLDSADVPASPFWQNRGITPVYIYRSGWNSPTDTYLGVKGGSPISSHGHMDGGSFVYERDGVRWAMDLGMQEYYELEKVGVDLWNSGQRGQRWDVFRIGETAHNTLAVNGRHHLVKGKAEITASSTDPKNIFAEVNMTPILADGLASAVRTVALDKKHNLTVTDRLTAPADTSANVVWTMLTPAEARILDRRTVELTKDGKRMLMKFDAGKLPFELRILSNDPPRDYDAPNPGSRRVVMSTGIPAARTARLTVRLTSAH